MPTYVPYSDAIEVIQPREEEISNEIVESMARINRLMFDKYRHAIRDAHAKSHGILKAELHVYPNLPEPLAQGVFREPRTYPVIVRFSTAPGSIQPDGVGAPQGMALKLVGVEGPKFLPEEANAVTQDFLLVNNPVIPFGTIYQYLDQQKTLEREAKSPEEMQKLIAQAGRTANKVLDALGIQKEIAGVQVKHILGETFFSMAALRYGDYVAKVRATPLSTSVKLLTGEEIDTSNHDSAIRDAVVKFFKKQSAEYEIQVQLCTDLQTMPVEDGSVEWPQQQSPYQPVARLVIPPQEAYSPARRVYADDVLSFNPFHCLPEHRPLGNIMRIRRKAYEVSSQYRHHMNAQPRLEPRSIEDLPD
ncbi:catalase [Siphonobacter sp. BAB-5385]|uniref:catalase family protein n=1 Tax=Siphonobacter sp. BAB-5385 TaxID=1864822 RepID=UPI000B9E90C6|nr:catalase family protein [Siphonobacter sp. BAB-5385]OZI05330.1 catalase [Siphonobacter sp. BAB-5385]